MPSRSGVSWGNGGGQPRIGDIIAENLSDEQVIELDGGCLDFYRSGARKKERNARFMERIPQEQFKAEAHQTSKR
ncbi:MAG: hypothetical protein KKC76_15180 [Proteobacteria bacterium]|nr:hypothetical protein [Pseudomonadota bacterium]MBU4296145.1 hypothetical protein [Pseudomonadota bacterium]MCG2747463.1 hypothetical protein [Desulfobulbaceae bacterium]